ncbi:metallophosphoesterase family protein [Candidatus Woesearchaeota archaeon]|nr:metallophosphoesterase family protein [Candidatus Woesearchaeota archaeon]
MKVLAFADVHASLTAMKKLDALVKKEKPDLLVNLGDFTIFEQHLEDVCSRLAKLHPVQLVVHGNHEEDLTTAQVCKRHGWVFCHKKCVQIGDALFVGYGGGGFSSREPEFERCVKNVHTTIKAAKKVVLLTHQPAFGTAVDNLYGRHVGNTSFTAFIKKYNVAMALSGHIHETAGKTGKLGKTIVANPGPFGKVFTV